MSEVEDFITAELERRSIDYEVRRDWIHVVCPFHPNSGTKRKLGISRTSGGLNCLVCGQKGPFNLYADRLDLKHLDLDDPQLQDFSALTKELERFRALDTRVPEQPDLVKPWDNSVWRGLPRPFLGTIPSYRWFDEASKADRILWPVYMNDIYKGCMAARIDPRDFSVFPKVRNLAGLDSKRILFPFDYPLVKESDAVVLVEGQFDALRLLYHGIPALSILGTGNWSDYKVSLLHGRKRDAKKIRRVVLAFDGDLAGERCTDAAMADGIDRHFDVRIMVFPDPTDDEKAQGIKIVDPGNCNIKYVRLIRRMLSD